MLRVSGSIIGSAQSHALYPRVTICTIGCLRHGISGYSYVSIYFLTDWEQTMNNDLCDGCLNFFVVLLKQAVHQIAGFKIRCNPFADLLCYAVKQLVDVKVFYEFAR